MVMNTVGETELLNRILGQPWDKTRPLSDEEIESIVKQYMYEEQKSSALEVYHRDYIPWLPYFDSEYKFQY